MYAAPRTLLPQLGGRVRFVPVGEDPAENVRWSDHDLSSLVEGTFGVVLDANALGAEERRHWYARVGGEWVPGVGGDPARPFRWHRRFWLVDDGDRVGTLALSDPSGRTWLPLTSLYVLPRARGRGLAAQALGLAQDAAVLGGMPGITLDTAWTWGRPAALYLRLGFHVVHWKDDLRLRRGPTLPKLLFETDGRVATATWEGHREPVIWAERRGDRLGWREVRIPDELDPAPTFALHLALTGFPLVRSRAAWERSREEGEVGGPESLARRIVAWEALARHEGYRVVPGRLPGLPYRAWDDLCDPPARTELVARLRKALGAFTLDRDREVDGAPIDLVSLAGVPVVIVAVLASRSLPLQRVPESVREVVVAYAGTPLVEVWRRAPGGAWRSSRPGEAVIETLGLKLDATTLYAGLALDELPLPEEAA